MYKVEKVLPYDENNQSKSTQVERMFDTIAHSYDRMNHTISWNLDKRWRRRSLMYLTDLHPQNILDVATGTGDFAIEAYKSLQPHKILGIDISDNMMREAKTKVDRLGLGKAIEFERQNCCRLSLDSNSFDAITVAFGVRNFENLDEGLSEMLRVLCPGGRLVILELSTPEHFPIREGYKIYSYLLPVLGKIFAKSKLAYEYLPRSISAFPQNKEMAEIMKKNGFVDVSYKKLSCGICSLYIGDKRK